MAGNQQMASLFQQSTVFEASIGSKDKIKSPWYKLFYRFKEISVCGYPDLPFIGGSGLDDSAKIFCQFVKKTSKMMMLVSCS